MLAAPFEGNLRVAAPRDGIDDPLLHLHVGRIRIRTRVESNAAIELLRLPRPQPFAQLPGEFIGIGGGLERERREVARFLMMAVPIGRRAAEARVDDERPEQADDAHVIGERVALAPLHRRFRARLREAVVEGVAEELLRAVEPPRLQQLLGADDAERVEQLGPDDVLSALAAVERDVGDARVIAARRARNERRILVVWMRARVEHAGRRLQALLDLREARRAHVVDRTHLSAGGEHERRQHEGDKQNASHPGSIG